MNKIILTIQFILALVIFFGCEQSMENKQDDDKLRIYTTIYPIQYTVQRIGGESVSAHSVYPTGVDVHTYEPTTKEMTNIAKADAFIYLGAGMEGFADSVGLALESTPVKSVEIGLHDELFQTKTSHSHYDHEHSHGDVDPHIWLDPTRLIEIASYVKNTLIDLQPNNKQTFTKNFDSLKKDLIQLDEEFQDVLSRKTDKTILVSHAAYGYWEERYGIEQLPINGLSSSEEPSQRDLTKIINKAESENMHYIIFEQNSSNRISEIIQHHIDAKALTIHNLAVLTDEDIEHHEDYISLMEKNLHVLDEALTESPTISAQSQ